MSVSYDSGRGFQPSSVEGNSSTSSMPAGVQLIVNVVGSEDSTDNDYNDGVVFLTAYPTRVNA